MFTVLTFPRQVAPYESSWLIMVKVVLINDITLRDLLSLVLKPESRRRGVTPNWQESHQFDIAIISKALSLPIETVRQSYIDIYLKARHPLPQAEIRHCSQCIKNLYHSSLFQLPWVTHCPVHNEKLTGCRNCTSLLADQNFTKLRQSGKPGRCLHLHPFRQHRFPKCLLSSVQIEQHELWARSLCKWLDNAAMVVPGELASTVMTSLDRWDIKNRFVLWRYLESKLGPAPISIPACVYPARRVALNILNPPSSDKMMGSTTLLIPSIKSVRRHICKRFLRRHRSCSKKIKEFNVMQSINLISGARCSC